MEIAHKGSCLSYPVSSEAMSVSLNWRWRVGSIGTTVVGWEKGPQRLAVKSAKEL